MDFDDSKFAKNNRQLAITLVRYKRKCASLEKKIIARDRLLQERYDEIVELKSRVFELEQYKGKAEASAMQLVEQNALQCKQFMETLDLHFPHHAKVEPVKQEPSISNSEEPWINKGAPVAEKTAKSEKEKTSQANVASKPINKSVETRIVVEKVDGPPKAAAAKTTKLKIFENLVDETPSTSATPLIMLPKVENLSDENVDQAQLGEKHTSLPADMELNESYKRSPVGKKRDFDEEVNTSLRLLKEKRYSEKLPSVPDERHQQAPQKSKPAANELLDVPSESNGGRLLGKRKPDVSEAPKTPVKSSRADLLLARSPTNIPHRESKDSGSRMFVNESYRGRLRDKTQTGIQTRSRSRDKSIEGEKERSINRPKRSVTPVDYRETHSKLQRKHK